VKYSTNLLTRGPSAVAEFLVLQVMQKAKEFFLEYNIEIQTVVYLMKAGLTVCYCLITPLPGICGNFIKQVSQLSLTKPRNALHHGKRQNFKTVT